MRIAFTGSNVEVIIYLLCVVTSLLCAWLLWRAYRRGGTRLLIWSALCFALLAINNLVLAADVLLLPDIDLSLLQLLTSLSAVCVLLYAFIWEV
jgi:Family of unknown function (DUF5985)